MKRCVTKISPQFNRLVIFNTTVTSYHGFPEPLNCPEGVTRKSIALYYYTESNTINGVVSTNYQVLPQQGFKAKVANWIDNKLIYLYTVLKRKMNGRDDVMSKALKKVNLAMGQANVALLILRESDNLNCCSVRQLARDNYQRYLHQFPST